MTRRFRPYTCQSRDGIDASGRLSISLDFGGFNCCTASPYTWYMVAYWFETPFQLIYLEEAWCELSSISVGNEIYRAFRKEVLETCRMFYLRFMVSEKKKTFAVWLNLVGWRQSPGQHFCLMCLGHYHLPSILICIRADSSDAKRLVGIGPPRYK